MNVIELFGGFVKKYIRIIEYCFIVSLFVLFLFNRFSAVFTTNIELGTGESNNVWSILNFQNGKLLYSNPEEIPFEIYQYAPLSQYLYAGLTCWMKPIEYLSMYHVLRFITLLLNFCIALLCYIFAKKEVNLSKQNSLVVAFVGLLLLGETGWLVRPDALSVVFSFSASIVAYYSLKKERYIYLSAILTVFALFTKQDAIQLIILIPFILVVIKEYKNAIRYFTVTIGVSLLTFYFFDSVYGKNFFRSVVGGVAMTSTLMNSFSVLNRLLQLYNIYPILVVVYALYVIVKEDKKDLRFLSLMILGTFVFAMGSSMKLGSGPSYYTLTNLLGLLLLSGIFKSILHKHCFNILVIGWAYYFFTGILFHYSSTAFQFDRNQYEQAKCVAEEIKSLVDKKFYLYTDNNYLKLQLYDHSILPNAEYYPVSPFNLVQVQNTKFYVYLQNHNRDYVTSCLLNSNLLKEIGVIDGKKLYVYEK